ncbi:MAG: PHP domain-containing protein, partial [Actinobacteria bacterium]|nr:PHP domain-containing protein [Actinomycetota bacterium]
MDKKEIVTVLNDISVLYELKDESFFKIRAYQMAARALEISDMEINKDITVEKLLEIKGIGKSIAGQVFELARANRLELYEELLASTPPGLIEMLKIPGLGPKKIKYLYDNLQISTIAELESACANDMLASLPGFGKKTQENILHGIDIIKKFKDRFLYGAIIKEAEKIISKLKAFKYVNNCSIAGSLRRKKEVIKDIDIVASTKNPAEVMDYFTNMDKAYEIISKGETKSSIRLNSGINVDIRIVDDFQYPYALHHFTGSKEHNTAMRSLAKKSGMKMNEYGLFKDDKIIECSSEKEIFSVFGMDYIEPELRENTGEIEAAAMHRLPDIISYKDIRGLFHFHTDSSDGNMSIEQAVKKLTEMKFEYCGVTEHSKSAAYAGGLDDKKIPGYIENINYIQEKYSDLKIFKGIESDILP